MLRWWNPQVDNRLHGQLAYQSRICENPDLPPDDLQESQHDHGSTKVPNQSRDGNMGLLLNLLQDAHLLQIEKASTDAQLVQSLQYDTAKVVDSFCCHTQVFHSQLK